LNEMKIVIAPDSFKGNMSASEAADCIAAGIKRVLPRTRCVKIPMADGGEGTVASLLHARGGSLKTVTVTGPARRPVKASYGVINNGRTAVIEMAAACGLPLISGSLRNPMTATSYGTGELIAAAIDAGVREIIIGLGGSATVDGGAGMAQALGVRFRDSAGRLIRRKLCGAMLDSIAAIDTGNIPGGLLTTRITAAADVSNPLCGRQGAARVYGPQKGATPQMVTRLDHNLRHFGRLIHVCLKLDVMKLPGAGAAGGMGAGLVAFTGASIRSGIDIVMQVCHLERRMQGADLVITGEGLIDAQTPFGKAPAGVARLARRLGIPVIAIGGALSDDARLFFKHGIDGLASAAARDISLTEAIELSRDHLADAAERCMRLIVIGGKISKKSSKFEVQSSKFKV
jgi:glycerate kinase